MNVSEEQLSAIDEELAALEDPERVDEILARFSEAERPSLAEVDEELEALAAALEDAEALLAAARASVPSTLVETPAEELPEAAADAAFDDEYAAEDDELEMFSEIPPAMDESEVDSDIPPPMPYGDADEDADADAEADLGADAELEAAPAEDAPPRASQAQEPSYSELEAQFFGDSQAPPAPSTPPADPEAAFFGDDGVIEASPPAISEDALFEDAIADEVAGGTGDLSDLFDGDELAAAAGAEPLADIASAPSVADIEHDLFDDDEPESTHIFTVEDVAAIERQSKSPPAGAPSEAELAADAEIDAILAANDAETAALAEVEEAPAAMGDAELDALFDGVEAESAPLDGDLTRSEPPPTRSGLADDLGLDAGDDDELEMMLDDDDLVVLDDDDLLIDEEADDDDAATMIVESPLLAQEAQASEEEEEEGDEKKGGFFKKLFGGDE